MTHDLTNEVEAEDAESHCAEEWECVVQVSEQSVQEWRDRWVHKDVQQDLKQPADAENHPHQPKEPLEVEDDDCHRPGIVRVCALHQMCPRCQYEESMREHARVQPASTALLLTHAQTAHDLWQCQMMITTAQYSFGALEASSPSYASRPCLSMS